MKNIAPNIFRQRLIIEAFFSIEVTRETLENYLLGLASHLNLKTYDKPTIFSPSSGMAKEDNQGFDENEAIRFTQTFFDVKDEIVSESF